MARGVTRAALGAMIREEWRLHTALFGGRRFGLFPVFVGAIGTGAVWLLVWTGSSPSEIALWLHLLVFAFGLYTGSAGLVGRDALRNLLGDVTLVVFSARTLPLAERRLLAAFLVKDVAYYAGLFLVPLTVAYGPAAVAAGTLHRLPLLWLTLTGTFLVGLVGTFTVIAARTRDHWGTGVLLVGAAGLGLAWAAGVDLLAWLPLGAFRDPGSMSPVLGTLIAAVLAVVALRAFDPTYEAPARTARPRLTAWRRRLRSDPNGLLTKTLLDVARSSGGVSKVLFSAGVLFVVTAALVSLAGSITGRPPSTGLAFGAILGLSAFTTYNWVTQFDDVTAYRALPLSIESVFAAKFRVLLGLGLPIGAAYYLLAIALWGERAAVALVGIVLLCGLTVYLFGLTVALAGLDPNEFLFDTVRFVGFTLGAAAALVPVLVVAFAVPPTPGVLVAVAIAGVVFGAGGVGLFRWAVPRWTIRYRSG